MIEQSPTVEQTYVQAGPDEAATLGRFGLDATALLGSGGEARIFALDDERVLTLAAAAEANPAVVIADPADCSFQFVPGELKSHVKFSNSCDIVKNLLNARSVSYSNEAAPAGSLASVRIGETVIQSVDLSALSADEAKAAQDKLSADLTAAIDAAGYPTKADNAQMNKPMVLLILTILVLYVTMVYGPIAAWLVELFPTRIRYTSMSLPYHIGNGWFGGFLPTTAFAMVAATGNIYYGLWYPIAIAVLTLIVGVLFVKEGKDVNIHD